MSIFVDGNTKVVYQGLTGNQGSFHGLRNRAYGTKVVAGTSPKKAGTDVDGVPIFATVKDAVAETGATASCIFIPAPGVAAAVMEAAEGGIEFIVVITEGVPAHDEARFYNDLKNNYPDVQLLGPNCPGIITPGECNIGITPGEIALAGGPVGIVSRSGTLTYQALYEMTRQGIGQTTCVGIGGDPVPGTSFIDCLSRFQADPDTKAIIMIGEIGGSAEEEAAEYIKANVTKPIVSYIAGVTAPAGKKMGHAGAIISGGKGTAAAKTEALEDAGARVAANPVEIGPLMAEVVAGL
ncbi:MAG: succinyl-CoA synthetase, alpha subunit [Actinomycetia bacterium]|nr:succinyl-CoA synthetase, alpha subunit [Actinomycetes bacterium]